MGEGRVSAIQKQVKAYPIQNFSSVANHTMLGGGGELVNANPTIYAVEDAPDDAGLAHNLDDDDEEG